MAPQITVKVKAPIRECMTRKRLSLHGRVRLAAALLIGLAGAATSAQTATPPPAAPPPPPIEMRYKLVPFGTVTVYRPIAAPVGVALFLSGDGGWKDGVVDMARALTREGLLVAGVSTPALMHRMEASKARCINPNYPLVDLARDVQHRVGVRAYMKPIVIGYSAGATVAYAGLAQWPNGGYRGVISMGFSADMPGHKPWCKAPGFKAKAITKPARGWLFAPSSRIKVPWSVLQGQQDQVVDPLAARAFVAAVPGAKLIELPKVGHGFAVQADWLPQMRTAIAAMLPPPAIGGPAAAALPDMPLTIMPARAGGNSDVVAVIYSGDGGWVGIDRDIAQQIAASGIPVVGVDSLSYFWSARTAGGAAADLNRLIEGVGRKWARPKVMLIGYSFGADTLPHIVRRLSPAIRSRVSSISLLGLSPTADFQFHLTSWLDFPSDTALPTVPAVTALKGMTIRCIRGMAESDGACPAIPQGISQNYVVPGGHHFDRNAALLTKIILGQRRPGIVRS